MIAQFLYKGPLRLFAFHYIGPAWIFLVVVVLLVLVLFRMIL